MEAEACLTEFRGQNWRAQALSRVFKGLVRLQPAVPGRGRGRRARVQHQVALGSAAAGWPSSAVTRPCSQ